MRDTEKLITLTREGKDHRYRLHLMDAFTGAMLLKLILEKAWPLLKDVDPGDPAALEATLISALPTLLSALTEQDTRDLMTRCLNHVDRELPAGWQAVMEGRNFGCPDLEKDTMTCLLLCGKEILFNLEGFFPERVPD